MSVEVDMANESSPVYPLSDGTAPPWASEWGEDQYGAFADLQVRGAVQRMRWIPPGSFLMGASEAERKTWRAPESEFPQHEVQMTRGYWLADTACSQELWLAVMRDVTAQGLNQNPSRFQGGDSEGLQRPVERLTWNDCQAFMKALKRLEQDARVPWLREAEPRQQWRLPTEAEWEYACRSRGREAGATTAFNFGDDITTQQVNFSGKRFWDDAQATLGEPRNETVAVKTKMFPPNGRGLHQMHGNVWEWCLDALRDYSETAQPDPVGSLEQGGHRVLRGGSWGYVAGYARSASRYDLDPGYRIDDIGFRLARGHEY